MTPPPHLPASSSLGWDRQAVTFRLTPERKRRLRAIVGDADDGSPTEALDLAIEAAAASGAKETDEQEGAFASNGQIATELGDLRLRIQELADVVDQWSDAPARLAQLVDDCAAIRRAVIVPAFPSERIDDVAVPLRAWLDKEIDGPAPWVVAKIRWLAKRSAGPGLAVWHVEMRELRRSGTSAVSSAPACCVALGPAMVNGALARLEIDGSAVLSCACVDGSWTASLRPALEDGKLGEPFAGLSV